MVLQYGAEERWAAAFHDEAEHRDAWERNRDRFLARYCHARRPAAWWRFESPTAYPGHDREQAALYEAGLLAPEERAELEGWWREQFQRMYEPGFFHCDGPGQVLVGEAAKRAHLKWAGVPRSLVRKWTAQRRRRSKTIRGLEAASPAEPPAAA
jgi:hypothetical protein